MHRPLSSPTSSKTCANATPCEGQNAFRHWRSRRKRDAVAQMYSNGNTTFSDENWKKSAVSGKWIQCIGLSALQQAQKHAHMPRIVIVEGRFKGCHQMIHSTTKKHWALPHKKHCVQAVNYAIPSVPTLSITVLLSSSVSPLPLPNPLFLWA